MSIVKGRKNYLAFDGSNDYVTVPTLLTNDSQDWVFETKFTFRIDDEEDFFITSGGPTNNDRAWQLFTFNNNNILRFNVYDTNGNSYAINLIQLVNDTTYIFRAEHDVSAKTIDLYVDNTYIDTLNYSGTIRNNSNVSVFGSFTTQDDYFANIDLYYFTANNHEYLLNEGSGTTINDSIGNNDGTIVGATWQSEANAIQNIYKGEVQTTTTDVYALNFDGVNDYVTMGDANDLDFNAQDFTLSAWFRTAQSSGVYRIIDKRGTGAAGTEPSYQISARPDDNDWGNTIIDDGNGNFFDFNNVPYNEDDSQWHLINLTWDNSTGTGRLYIDGVLKGTKTNSNLINADLSTTRAFELGRANTDSQYFNGEINKVRVYGRRLSDSEILDLYNGNQVSTNNLISRWIFSEGSGSTLGDSVGSNDGTIVGASWTGVQETITEKVGVNGGVVVPRIYLGQTLVYGEAPPQFYLLFDGNNDYIDIPHVIYNDFPYTLNMRFNSNVIVDNKTLASAYNNTSNTNLWHALSVQFRFNEVEFFYFDGATKNLTASVSTNQWYNLTVVVSQGRQELWLNGTLVASDNSTGLNFNNPDGFYIGTWREADGRFFDGEIDNVSVFNSALSSSDIQNIHANDLTLNGNETNLQAYYNFNEGSGTTVNDTSGNNYDGTINGATWGQE